MTIPPEGEGTPEPLAEQQALADHLIRLGTSLQQQHEADPVLVMETALAAVALTRTWLEPDTVQVALAAVPREQLAWWEHELVEDEVYVARLLDAVRAALIATSQSLHAAGAMTVSGWSSYLRLIRRR